MIIPNLEYKIGFHPIRENHNTGFIARETFDDDEQEITRCVVEQWIDNKDEDFYDSVAAQLRKQLHAEHELIDNLGITKPYSFVLENDDNENVAELYLADDDTVIIGGDLMEGLDQDLDQFFDHLMEE